MTSIEAARVLTPGGWVGPATVQCTDGRIVSIEQHAGSRTDRVLVPGFVDLQVNGIDDVDVATAAGGDWERLDRALLAQGVTSWCPTLLTAPLDAYAAPLARIAAAQDGHPSWRRQRRPEPRPDLIGCHLEGPFLGGAPGAHRRDLIVDVDLHWLDALPPVVRMMTIAPEAHGAVAAIEHLVSRGVLVSIGHTTASAEQCRRAVDAGARLSTHLFNAMSGLHHRAPGVAAHVLGDRRLAASLIADGVHVHPQMLFLAFELLGRRAVLVTDAVAWRDRLELRDGVPRLPDGTMAGSALTMDRAVSVCVAAGIDLAAAAFAASTAPAQLLGLHDRGRIAPGARADLVALTPELAVEQTWVEGLATR